MKKQKDRIQKRIRRRIKIRAKIKGTKQKPRLSVFRSDKYIWLQLIDDEKGYTLCSASEKDLNKTEQKKTKKERSYLVGKILAQKALTKKIKKIVFDRGGYKYHGRVKAVADGAREGGLQF